jgi:NAD(P)-dependent dehydrogenase (short-subunit alcohol dehydrogenase family)
VLVGYRRSRQAAESVVGAIVAAGGVASACQLDVTDQASVDRFVEQAESMYGRVDVLVNTAGRLDGADTVRFEDMSADAATALLAVDVIGAMRMCHAVIPHMRRHGRGAIINFSSSYGNGVNPENAINWVPVTYCACEGCHSRLHGVSGPRHRVGDPRECPRPRPDLWELGTGVGNRPGAHR